MNRHTDCTSLICKCTSHRLTNPPSRICTQLVSLRIIKLLYALDQTEVTLLNKIQKAHATSGITLCNADHKTQVRLNQALLRMLIALCLALCQSDLLICAQQRNRTDLL